MLLQCCRTGVELNLANKFIENVMSSQVYLGSYNKALIAFNIILLNEISLRHPILGRDEFLVGLRDRTTIGMLNR